MCDMSPNYITLGLESSNFILNQKLVGLSRIRKEQHKKIELEKRAIHSLVFIKIYFFKIVVIWEWN